jgi:hypothetical protein
MVSLGHSRRRRADRRGENSRRGVEGQSIALEARWAEGAYDRYPTLTADLVREQVDVIVAVGRAATQTAQQVTRPCSQILTIFC